MVLRTNFIKAAAIGLAVACTSLFAKATDTPNQYQQNDWFAEFGGNTAMYVNPAGISEADQLEFSVAFFSSTGGEASQEYVSLTYPIDYKHTLGISLFEKGAPFEDGESYGEIAAQFGYAYRLFHLLSLGVNFDVLYINQFDKNYQLKVNADAGLSWNPLASSKYGYLLIGASIQNLLAPIVDEADDAYKIPTNLNLSLFYRGFNRLLEFKAEFSILDLIHDSKDGKGCDLEMSFSLTYYLFPHLGVRARYTKDGNPVLGATINFKDLSIFRYLALDLEMSHDDLWAKKNRGFVWAVKFTTRFGDTREEKVGEERYRRLIIQPENDYYAAKSLYLNRQFLDAAYAFGEIQTKYPTFRLVDQAAFYEAKSFENLRMHKAAREIYRDAIKRYPQSDQIAKYHFQLMNINYKEGKYKEAMAIYQTIAQKFGKSDAKADADYVAGQIKFEQGLYQESIDLHASIPPGNANYLYARYTMGIANSRMSKFDEAENCFRSITEQPVSNKSERDIQNAAKVKLGHLFFSGEKPDIAAAARMYGLVQKDSPVFDEAMLGIAWAFIKANKPDEAIKYAKWIINNLPESFLVSEAYLVMGYCNYIKKNYQDALEALNQAENRTEQPIVSVASRDSARQAYDAMQSLFDSVQVLALDFASQLPTPRVESKRNALRPTLDKASQAIEDYASFMQRAIQSDRFESNRKRILDDAGFPKPMPRPRFPFPNNSTPNLNLGELEDDL
ncbi:tetratricopeptide repeat protein [Fibrobacter succinogenes]|uniref:tetratricopeptide repeat protein n=1 Tax=Fibrobacter succinogenes TaxID=833 RepID=UPI0026F33830|nr:tetratricopeptide repeat protein [Fibrobacter succinogenes]